MDLYVVPLFFLLGTLALWFFIAREDKRKRNEAAALANEAARIACAFALDLYHEHARKFDTGTFEEWLTDILDAASVRGYSTERKAILNHAARKVLDND